MSYYAQPSNQKTLQLTVANMGFMLDRLGRDCSPLQFLRELTQNSVEAILRHHEGQPNQVGGQICWDVDWNRFDLEGDGVYKLAVTDTGDGMTGPEMVKYINQLSSSINPLSFQENYGIGAKIAAATRNRLGLIYLSWKDGQGAMIHLWRDPDTRQYGLRQFEHPDGNFDYWLPIEDSVKPEIIQDHGTMVVLLGNKEMDHTIGALEGTPSPSRWIAKNLNTRYFKFPDNILIRAREGWTNPRTDTDRNLMRTLSGQQPYLEEHSETSGEVRLTNGLARWWILRDETALSQNSGFVNSSGHAAALYKDELYEVEIARSGVARLQQFGVIFGYQRVVIYVEPDSEETAALTTNTARTQLLVNGEPLPWLDWAAEFRENMPQQIKELIEEVAAGSASKDHSQSIRDRLNQIRDLFKLSRYRPSPSGELFFDEGAVRRGGKSIVEQLERKKGETSRSGGGKGGRAGDVYAVFATEKGTRSEKVEAYPYPEVRWISIKDGTRAPAFLEDRAGTYLSEQNLLQINGDFRVFPDMVNRYCKLYSDVSGAEEIIKETVREWFEQTLIEVILGVQALEGAREWSVDEIAKAFSEESLSAAVMPRYHVDFAIKRSLGTKLGSLKRSASR